jgi:predicted cobalt transporter CbtA
MLRKLALIVTTLWVGGLWMTGLTATILFDTIQDRQLAGNVAGHLFTTISYIGLVSGLYLLIQCFLNNQAASFKQGYFWIVMLMLLLILVGQFGIQPLLTQMKLNALPNDVMNSIYASRFSAWHGVAGVVYLTECFLGIALVLKQPLV